MSVVSEFVGMRGLVEESGALRLLRARNAPVILAIIGSSFDENRRRIPVPDFETIVDADLAELAQRLGVVLERSAHDYCEDWRRDGYLICRPLDQGRMEAYEPSPEALTALAFVRRLREPPRVATESRLNTIIEGIGSLALAIDTDVERRAAAIRRERDALTERLRDLEEGRLEPMPVERAVERARDIVALAQEIPLDFSRVRRDFEEINATLYETIVDAGEGSDDVLEDVFSGVDRIASSPSGVSFRAFYDLLADVDLSETLEDEVRAILDHPLAAELTLDQRIFLRDLMRILLRRSEEVDEEMVSFARGLRRFVRDRNYQRDRILKRSIDHSLGLAHRLVASSGLRSNFAFDLELPAVSLRPVSRLRLKDPLEDRSAPLADVVEEAPPISFERLRAIARESEIDFAELAANVNRSLEERRRAVGDAGGTAEDDDGSRLWVSVGEVLAGHPATQGLSSVIGLMALASDQGEPGEGTERVFWTTRSGRERSALIGELRFYEEVDPV